MKKRWVLVILWLQLLLVAAMIFYFSSEDGTASAQTSGKLMRWLVHFFHPEYDTLRFRERRAILHAFEYAVRKCAHFTEFALLGYSLRLLFEALSLRKPLLLSCLAGIVYACTDEFHQRFTGRSPMLLDVAIDSSGVIFGALMITLVLYLFKRRRRKRNLTSPDEPSGH